MKKLVLSSIVLLLTCCNLFSKELKQSVCTELEKNENLIVLYNSYNAEKDKEIFEQASQEGKFILRVINTTWDDYYTESKKSMGFNYKEYGRTKKSISDFIEKQKCGIEIIDAPSSDISISLFKDFKNYTVRETFSSCFYYPVRLIGIYSACVMYSDGNMCFYYLEDPCVSKNNHALEKQLSDYLVYEPEPGMNGYFWKSEETFKKFYRDMKAKNRKLPEYVIKFQKVWDEVLAEIQQ